MNEFTPQQQQAFDEALDEYTLHRALTVAQDMCHARAVASGWWTDLKTGDSLRGRRNVGEQIALMHSELSEALEAHRKDLMDDKVPSRKGLEVELADALIRILDFAGGFDLDMAGAVVDKLAYNREREDHKPENRSKEGGKAFQMDEKELPPENRVLVMNEDDYFKELISLKMQLDTDLKRTQERYQKYLDVLNYGIIKQG